MNATIWVYLKVNILKEKNETKKHTMCSFIPKSKTCKLIYITGVSVCRTVPTNFKKHVQPIICQLYFSKSVKTHINVFTHIHKKNVQNLHEKNTPK